MRSPIQDYTDSSQRGFFRFKKLSPEKYLLTNDIGKYIYLSKEDFHIFLQSPEKLSFHLQEELRQNYFLKSENYESEMSLKMAQKNFFVGKGPSLHILVTTLRCNHACQYCHASVVNDTATEYDMSIDTAKKVVDTIFYSNSTNLTIEFQGGESLLNFPVIEFVVSYAKQKAYHLKKQLSLVIVTNLTLLSDAMLDYFLQEGVDICTSLDGDEKLHNYNRSYTGNSFEEVTTNIRKINNKYQELGQNRKMGCLLTTTRFTLSRHKEIVDTYLSLGLDSIYIRPLNPYGFASKKLALLGYSYHDFLEFYEKAFDYILEINKSGTFFKEGYASIFLTKILTETDPNFLDSRSPCGACIGQLAYNYDGKVYTCDEGRMFARMGDDIFGLIQLSDDGEKNYRDIMASDTTKCMVQASTLDGLPGYNDHVYKPYLGACPIYSYKSSGNIHSNFSKDNRTRLDIAIIDILFQKLQDSENKKVFYSWIGKNVSTDTFICS